MKKISVIVKIELDTIDKENWFGKYKEGIFKIYKKCLLGKYNKKGIFQGVPYEKHNKLKKGDVISIHKKYLTIDREDVDFFEFEFIDIIEENKK